MSRTSVTSRDLAAFLAAQLEAEVARAGFRTVSDGPDVVLVDPDGGESRNGTAAILDDDGDERSGEDRVVTATTAVLGHVQDAVSLQTGLPWPGTESKLPLPGARVVDGLLVGWYGEATAPAWRSAELPLSR